MKRNFITLLAAGMVSAAVLGGGVAFADSKNDQSEIALFQRAAHDINAAIKTAETASGGKAVGAEFEEKGNAGVWEVDTVVGTKRVEVKIDAANGQVIKTKDKGDVADKDEPVTPDMLSAPLSDLVTKAEAEGGGKVISIKVEHKNGTLAGMSVEIVKADGTAHDFVLNQDGKLTPAAGDQEDGQDGDGESGETNG